MSSKKKIYNRNQQQYMSKRLRARLFKAATLLIFAAAMLLADKLGLFPTANSDDYERYNDKQFTVVKVIDGDTLDVNIPDLRQGYKTTRVRMLGIDTPETKRPNTPVQHFGPEASKKTTQLALNKTVTLKLPSARRTRGNYDRLLAYIILPDGKMLNRLLVTEGYAYADSRFAHPHLDDFTAEMSIARREKRGLWAEVADSELPSYIKRR